MFCTSIGWVTNALTKFCNLIFVKGLAIHVEIQQVKLESFAAHIKPFLDTPAILHFSPVSHWVGGLAGCSFELV